MEELTYNKGKVYFDKLKGRFVQIREPLGGIKTFTCGVAIFYSDAITTTSEEELDEEYIVKNLRKIDFTKDAEHTGVGWKAIKS